MPHADPESLRAIKTLPQLVACLRNWPIEQESIEDLIFDYPTTTDQSPQLRLAAEGGSDYGEEHE